MERELIRIRVTKKKHVIVYDLFMPKETDCLCQVRFALNSKEELDNLLHYISEDGEQSSPEIFGEECDENIKKLIAFLKKEKITFFRCLVRTEKNGNYVEYNFRTKGETEKLQKSLEKVFL